MSCLEEYKGCRLYSVSLFEDLLIFLDYCLQFRGINYDHYGIKTGNFLGCLGCY